MTVTFKGDREIDAFLAQLPVNIRGNTGRRALRRGAVVLADAARGNIRSETGLTAADITVSTRVRDGVPTAKVKLSKKRAYIGWFLEKGVAPHFISAGESNLSPRKLTQQVERAGTLKIGDKFVGSTILHPGFGERPFMRPAMDTHGEQAIQAVADYLRGEMQKGGFRSGGAADGDDE